MGRGIIRNRNKLKEAVLSYVKKENERLVAENTALKTNPDGVIAPFLKQLNELSQTNSRLSALTCALIREYGKEDKILIKKATLDGFNKHRLSVLMDPNEETGIYEFHFTATTAEQDAEAAAIAAAEPATETTPTTEPITEALPEPVVPDVAEETPVAEATTEG